MAAAAVRELLLSFSSAALLLLLLFLAQQPPVSSLNVITHLPGFEGPLPFHLETGYVDVDEANGVQLFYYFIRSERKPADDPLMVWITGGPGCSAFSGLMYEIGPLQFDVAGYTFGLLPSLIYNPISWTKWTLRCQASSFWIHQLGLDSPIRAPNKAHLSLIPSRPSMSAHFLRSGMLITHHSSKILFTLVEIPILAFLCQSLLNIFQMVNHYTYEMKLEMGGTSISRFRASFQSFVFLHEHCSEIDRSWFQGYLVGNPSTDGEYDGNAIIPYVHGMGLISDELYEATKRSCGGQYQSPGNAECASCLQAVSQGLFGINNVHILEPLCFFASPKRNILTADRRKLLEEHLEQPLSKSDLPLQCRVNPFLFLKPKLHFRLLLLEKKNPCVISGEPSYQSSGYVLSYFWANNDTVREALGVREGTKQMWVRCNYGINYTNDVPSSLKYHLSLTSRGYRALAYSGDHDMSVPFVGTQAWIRSLNFSIVDDWRSWFVDGQVAGFTRSYSNNLTFVTIKGAGHTAPEYKPKECLAMVDRWFAGSPL
ncbi:serine carboxypeptidase-like [Musa troglodytarum]|uniref:Serine carboxypeptidase-like n=1 Tax=Musa troglodytarum TaxID=320322 RepID=A0A9E7EW61_9LILI|nr:serine carboxypeptidase-like [Musa troglodytarum]